MKKLKLTKGFHSDCCSWQDCIEVTLSDTLQSEIANAKAVMRQMPAIRSINLAAPVNFMSWKTADTLYDQCAYDVEYITVYPFGDLYYTLQSKYDARIQAEYGVEC